MLYETFFELVFIIFPNYEHECDRPAADMATDIGNGVRSARQPHRVGTLSSFVLLRENVACMPQSVLL